MAAEQVRVIQEGQMRYLAQRDINDRALVAPLVPADPRPAARPVAARGERPTRAPPRLEAQRLQFPPRARTGWSSRNPRPKRPRLLPAIGRRRRPS